ncbi:hypothetical protein [Sodalis ligni]|uniref:Uncharacterized protein n=1 Tax=Sodalis ligni TaxID=2697027 RepID=A0A4R1NAK0_9GAMM|nr:hypothetical protein [Sodalis ligni]TCL02581.1 hypothetical protein EZJ58_0604 [Sodalis ligni]
MGSKPPSSGGRSTPWRGKPAIADRATSLLKGDRGNGAGAAIVGREAPHARVGPLSSIVQRAC